MVVKDDEEERLWSVAFQNAQKILHVRRLAEEELRKQSEWMRVTLASIGDAVICTDVESLITFMNGVAESLTGWSGTEAMAHPLPEIFRIVNEQSREPVENPAARALREGTVVGLANHTILIARDGMERPIDDSAAPIRNEQGEVAGVVLVFRDITDRRRAEADRQKLVSLAENSTDFIGMCDLNAVPFYINRAGMEMVGLDPKDDIRHFPVKDFFFPEDQEKIIGEFFPSVLARGDGEIEVRFRHFKTRAALWMLFRVFALSDSKGKRVGLATVSRDITQRRQLEDHLRQMAAELSEANRRKDEFLATLAHELRNPLAPMRNGLQLMRIKGAEDAVMEQARAMMERQLGQLVRLVDDLMDVSRISRGKLELRKELLPLVAVINNAVETSRPLIEQMGHELAISLPKQPIILEADMTRLAQVFMNLLNNSAKYTNRGGRIWLTAERQGNEVVVSVKDNGIGMAANHLPRIFEMFSQVDHSLEKSQGGLGIGLTLVKRLVELHGGKIEARSEGPDTGSEFIVRLPVMVEAASVSRNDKRGEEDRPSPGNALRILIVDDNRDSADSLAMILKVMGNDTRTAYDGEEAVRAAKEFRPRVVLLDIGLPKLNGYETCRCIREQPGNEKVVIIAQTGWGQDDDRQRTKEAGFDYHLVKPVDPTALLKILASMSDAAKK